MRAVLGPFRDRLTAGLADIEFLAARLAERRLRIYRSLTVRTLAFFLLGFLRHNDTPY